MSNARTGVFLLLAAVTMLFAAFTSAMVVRRGLSDDWGTGVPFPAVLWMSTLFLIASSICLWRGERGSALVLGACFAAAQIVAWRQLLSAGVAAASSPGAAFFYVFTGAHAVHVAGGLGVLAWAAPRPAAIYWHFLTVLWLYLIVLFRWWGN